MGHLQDKLNLENRGNKDGHNCYRVQVPLDLGNLIEDIPSISDDLPTVENWCSEQLCQIDEGSTNRCSVHPPSQSGAGVDRPRLFG